MKDPTGNAVGMKPELLHNYSPFSDFTIPGVILFSYLGILSVITAIVIWFNKPWACLLGFSQGGGIIIWIITQAIMIRTFHPLQVIIGSGGLIVMLLSIWLYSQRNFNK